MFTNPGSTPTTSRESLAVRQRREIRMTTRTGSNNNASCKKYSYRLGNRLLLKQLGINTVCICSSQLQTHSMGDQSIIGTPGNTRAMLPRTLAMYDRTTFSSATGTANQSDF